MVSLDQNLEEWQTRGMNYAFTNTKQYDEEDFEFDKISSRRTKWERSLGVCNTAVLRGIRAAVGLSCMPEASHQQLLRLTVNSAWNTPRRDKDRKVAGRFGRCMEFVPDKWPWEDGVEEKDEEEEEESCTQLIAGLGRPAMMM